MGLVYREFKLPGMILYSFLVLSSLAFSADLTVLGGLCISDYSMISQLPEEINFNKASGGSLVILRVVEEIASDISLGIECGVQLDLFKWIAESDSSFRSEEVENGHIELGVNWYPDVKVVMPYARLGARVQWGNVRKHYERGELVIDDIDGMSRALGLTIGGGARVPFYSSLYLQAEFGYTFLWRKDFPGWQVTEVNNMNNLQALIGLGVSL